jgi:hypothetical protein
MVIAPRRTSSIYALAIAKLPRKRKLPNSIFESVAAS